MREIRSIGVIGAGVMGQGIAQLAVTAGLDALVFDAKDGAAQSGCEKVLGRLERLVEKEKLAADDLAAAKRRLRVADRMEDLADCEVVIEAIIEDREIKRDVFRQLEAIVAPDAILASNTSSLPIASIARACERPERIAGMHFFNPAPIMKLVEIISGPATAPEVAEALEGLAERLGRTPVRVVDSPGFLVNLGGRAYVTEALAILSEQVAPAPAIDAIMRDCWGFRMGPFELMDLTGIDVNYPVTKLIHEAFAFDPRLRTRPAHALLYEAGYLGRKSGRGFYDYEDGDRDAPAQEPDGAAPGSVWLPGDDPFLAKLCRAAKVAVADGDDGRMPILVAPVGRDISTTAAQDGLDHRRLVGIDPLGDTDKRVTIMTAPGVDEGCRDAVLALCRTAGRQATMISDSPGFVGQRIVAMVANLGCEMAQMGLAAPEDIDTAMRLGLNYPQGPLALCDAVGPARVLEILEALQAVTGDDRYRPSLWLRRRAQLGLTARTPS